MIHRHEIEAVDCLLRDIMNAPEVLFRGQCIVFGGDVRQILPVVPGASPAETRDVNQGVSPFWAQLAANFCLTINLRLHPNAGNLYPEHLRSVGKGTHIGMKLFT
jgi:hypothetical protein